MATFSVRQIRQFLLRIQFTLEKPKTISLRLRKKPLLKKEISLRVIRALPRMKSFEASPTERASFKAAEKLQSKLSFKGKKKC